MYILLRNWVMAHAHATTLLLHEVINSDESLLVCPRESTTRQQKRMGEYILNHIDCTIE